jgi:hypothetical protein
MPKPGVSSPVTTCLRHGTVSARGRYRSVAYLAVLAVALGACKSPTTNTDSIYQSATCPVPAYVPEQTNAADWPCPPAADIQEINTEISVQFQDGDPSAGTLRCHADQGSMDLTPQQERAYQALYLLKRLQFDAPLPWTSQSLWAWFTASVNTIQFLPAVTGSDVGG